MEFKKALRQAFNCFSDYIEHFIAVGLGVGNNSSPHAWFPEIANVLFHTFDCQFSIRFGFKEAADVVGHCDEIFNIHKLGLC